MPLHKAFNVPQTICFGSKEALCIRRSVVIRYRIDVPGQEKRMHRRERICPISGPGLLGEPEIERRAKKRSPIAAATAAGYRSYLKKWLFPHVGDLPLASVDNKAARDLVAKLSESRLLVATAKGVAAASLPAPRFELVLGLSCHRRNNRISRPLRPKSGNL